MFFYFPGAGTSLYAGKQRAGACRSIPRLLRSGRPLDFSAGRIGIVAPIYGHELPGMVKDFLKTARFDTNYFFLILTYGNRHANAVELARQFCGGCGLRVDYINQALMVVNWLPSFAMNEQRRLVKQDNGQLAINDSGLFGANGQAAAATERPVLWRSVENSNVDMLQEMSRMMSAQRALQSASQVLKLYDGVLTKATTELGRM